MSAGSVLFDAPGPRARLRAHLYTALFTLVLLAVAWFVFRGFADKNQWNGALWKPFIEGATWSEFLLPGLLNTIEAALLSVVIAIPIGVLLGIGRMSVHRWVSAPCGVIVEFFRAIPVLLLMVFAAELYFTYTDVDSETRPLLAVVTGLVLYNGSVLAEIVRSGIKSLPRGQAEAAAALGMRSGQIMRSVQLPQAVSLMLPAIVSQLVVILKDTALGGQLTVGYTELVRSAGPITANFNNSIPTLIVLAAIFIVLNYLLTLAAALLQRRLSRSRRTPPGAKVVVNPGATAGTGAGVAL
ncbi:amino acid ABC transporter permease [Pseudonocardia sp. N23]|uniref:amino acid ABC transporter permease n=1 Tax=Pseudonocardia sp. N23 TaxID=1987376 RepID=UPI000BFE14CF|nr:amino acid ABC transporter permease [Pseudonocardia sp. N23]GAY07723.1 glutamate permease [Pseudonocardia sp. N23]